MQGNGSISGSSFSSTNAKDFNFEGLGILSPTVSASVTSKSSFSGSLTYPGPATATFATTYDAADEATPSLTTVAGTYTGNVTLSQGFQAATLTIASNGAVTGSGQGGCTFSGTTAPHVHGNVYDFAITFGTTGCFFAGQTFTGHAYYDATSKTLYAAALNAGRTDGVLFVGPKP